MYCYPSSSLRVSSQRLNDLLAYIQQTGKTNNETAMYFLMNFEDQWKERVPQSIFDRVRITLP